MIRFLSQGSGCISVGSHDCSVAFDVDRIIECVWIEPDHKRCVVNADIFLKNNSGSDQTLWVIHRGGLLAENATLEAWRPDQGLSSSWPRAMASRIVKLHENFDPLLVTESGVTLNGIDYRLWSGPLRTIVGNPHKQVPFTMWEIGPFDPGQATLVRLQLTLSEESYDAQIGDQSEFAAYGDQSLLNLIREEDLPVYFEDDLESYEDALASFQSHIVPGVFEWLLVSAEDEPGRWTTRVITSGLSPRIVPEPLNSCTHWFLADYASVRRFQVAGELKGRPTNSFELHIHAVPPGVPAGIGG